jgi:putative methyltransferase (TIGR04325 family)
VGWSIRDFLPPVLTAGILRLRGRYGYSGNYRSWDAARSHATGYDSESILAKVRVSALKVKNGEAVYERDSVLFDTVEYSWPLLAALLWIASRNGNRLNVVDFGGSLGSTYFQNKEFLRHLVELHWKVVEQARFVDCGKREFENDHLKFFGSLEASCLGAPPDAILFSSVLQYLEKPYSVLAAACEYGCEFLLFDRTTFIDRGNDRITLQKVPPEIYDASYPAWFFNREKFLEFLAAKYDLVAEFDALAGAIPLGTRYGRDKGFIFRKKFQGGRVCR